MTQLAALPTIRILSGREGFGLRWLSEAATPLFGCSQRFQSGVARPPEQNCGGWTLRFPPQSKRVWWRLRCAMGVSALLGLSPVIVSAAFPDYQSLASGAHQVRLLPAQRDAVFTMYGTPGDLNSLKRLVAVMRERGLGNGFDPGPAPRPNAKPLSDHLATVGWPAMRYPGCADMQIKGGRCA